MIARTNEGKIDYKKIIIESGLYLVLFCMPKRKSVNKTILHF